MNYSKSRDSGNVNPRKLIALCCLCLFSLALTLSRTGLYAMIIKCDFCGKEFKTFPSQFKNHKHHFCSQKCYFEWKGGGKKVFCEYCNKELYKTSSAIKRTNHNFCSMKCFHKWQFKYQTGENSPHWKGGEAQRICKTCNKVFSVPQALVKNGRGKFCSIKCRAKWQSKYNRGKKHPRWKKKVKCTCKTCRKTFYVEPNIIKRGYGKFCSLSCSSIYTIKHFPNANTSIELKVRQWLDNLNIPYEQQVLTEGICRPDFLLENKLIIECDGDFWHSSPNAKTRDAKKELLLGFKGYTILRLTETDINKHSRRCINRIKELIENGNAYI